MYTLLFLYRVSFGRMRIDPAIAVLVQEAVCCTTVRQLYSQDMQTLPPLYLLAPTAVLPVTPTLLAEVYTQILVFCIMRIYTSCDELKKYEDMVGRTRDQRWVCGAIGRRDGLSL
jgi:hypothetical protein